MYSKKNSKEHTETVKLATKLNWLLKDVLWFKIPNERANVKERLWQASEGVKAGTPDIFIAEPRKGRHGLFLELKRLRGGVISKKQKEFCDIARLKGYKVEFPKGADEAFSIVKSYLGDDNNIM